MIAKSVVRQWVHRQRTEPRNESRRDRKHRRGSENHREKKKKKNNRNFLNSFNKDMPTLIQKPARENKQNNFRSVTK